MQTLEFLHLGDDACLTHLLTKCIPCAPTKAAQRLRERALLTHCDVVDASGVMRTPFDKHIRIIALHMQQNQAFHRGMPHLIRRHVDRHLTRAPFDSVDIGTALPVAHREQHMPLLVDLTLVRSPRLPHEHLRALRHIRKTADPRGPHPPLLVLVQAQDRRSLRGPRIPGQRA